MLDHLAVGTTVCVVLGVLVVMWDGHATTKKYRPYAVKYEAWRSALLQGGLLVGFIVGVGFDPATPFLGIGLGVLGMSVGAVVARFALRSLQPEPAPNRDRLLDAVRKMGERSRLQKAEHERYRMCIGRMTDEEASDVLKLTLESKEAAERAVARYGAMVATCLPLEKKLGNG